MWWRPKQAAANLAAGFTLVFGCGFQASTNSEPHNRMQAVAKPAGGGVPVLAVEGDDEEVVLCCFLADADLGEVRLPPVTLSLRKKICF